MGVLHAAASFKYQDARQKCAASYKRGKLQPRVVPQLDERQCQGRYKPSALARSALAAHLEVRLKVCQVALLRREEL